MRRTAIALSVAAAVLGLAACDPKGSAGTGAETTAARPAAGAPSQPAPPSGAPVDAKTATLPDFVGMGLQSAQDAAQSAGFLVLTSHDALGRDRNQISDRNWKVCTQNPAPGDHPTTTKIDMGAVKLDESCPTQDQGVGGPAKAGSTMPDFKGKAVSVVRDSLPGNTSINAKDASPKNRAILVQSNWQVCGQDPAPGAALTGQPVSVKAVKFGETCP
ncbi:hypothetical protein GCM10018790_64140 [Kitasatospora xanthocidica]|uniref:PASTA domain-containing protein n=1 Tax=Kitasatospora xanthocidica TaxID=83382 RepID=UPI001671FD53|nr:PASTA domain-containing protein [Kitasatospora xanthocidica]GHF77204.1 hypothetical protein GCM10018790_64140 [Kitasatospora xanthocidica]